MKHTSIALPDELNQRIRTAADKTGVCFSTYIRMVLVKHLAKQDKLETRGK